MDLSDSAGRLCAYCGLQAEHPLVLQIQQRRSWKPRCLIWAGVYGEVAGAIALEHGSAALFASLAETTTTD
ncbi:MAG: hypothetical protein AAFW95_11695 [Cyanobacteria bacterium J06638_6]